MRGCVAILLFLSTVLPISAQCNYSLGYSGPFRASYLDLAVDGNDLWAATAYGVQLFDRSVDPPSLVASIAVPGVTRVVRVISGTVYAGSGSRVYAIHKNGKSLSIIGSVDAGATVNDILATPLDLYVATSNGLWQYDLLNPAAPARTSNPFLTSGANITSLALLGSTLYAADGDSSLETFNISVPNIPVKTADITTLPRANAVEASGTRLYVSDGLATEVFIPPSGQKIATSSFGSVSVATLATDVIFTAGTDRRFHAIDWTLLSQPVELFASEVVPNGGTINRVGAIRVAGNRMYVAAGDAGLLTYDIGSFTSPYAVRNYPSGGSTSAAWVDGKLYVGRAAGGISEFIKGASNTLTPARQWDAKVHTIHDGGNTFLLTSSGATVYYWTLTSAIPTLVTSATFSSNVVSAVLIGFTAYAVLDNGTFASADVSKVPAPAQAITLPNFKPSFVAHSGDAVALAQLSDDGTTTVAFYPNHDFTTTPQTIAVAGSASSGIAMNGATVALFTFRGINLIDFAANGSTSVLAQSNSTFVRRLGFSSGSLFALTDDSLVMWNLATGKVARTFALPQTGTALTVDTLAAIATADGVTTVAYNAASIAPSLVATRGGNAYYKKALASPDRLYLFDGRAVDVFETRYGFAPDLINSVRPAGIFDFAITPSTLFTITSNGTVAAWSRDGALLSQATLNEGTDVQILGINAAGGVPWVSIARGCFTGACEKKTVVLDPKSLVRTATLDGAAIDVAENGNTAFAIFDLPAEIRAYSEADPLHPAVTASVASEGSKTPVSIAFSGNSVYVDGEKLYVYTPSLTKSGEQFDTYQADATNTLQYTDQRVRADGGCVLVTARTFTPQYLSGGTPPTVPAVVKSVATVPGRFYVLTDDSLEVWTNGQAVPLPKRRAAH